MRLFLQGLAILPPLGFLVFDYSTFSTYVNNYFEAADRLPPAPADSAQKNQFFEPLKL
jgi:hypothetical protein